MTAVGILLIAYAAVVSVLLWVGRSIARLRGRR